MVAILWDALGHACGRATWPPAFAASVTRASPILLCVSSQVVRRGRPSSVRARMRLMPQRQASARSRHPVLRESTIAVDGLTVVVLRKNIVNMYLRVRPRGAMVVVSAPARVSQERIVAFVRAKARWIAAQRSRLLDAETNGDVLVWTPDAEAASRRVIEERLPGLLSRWQPIVGRSPSAITIRGLLSRWQPIVGRSPSAITIRRMTTRWGSCTPATGRIRLNLQLGLMDPKFLEYVLVHEMTHLWARGHGEGFQHLMDGWLPGWRDVRREMNRQWVLPPASPSPPR